MPIESQERWLVDGFNVLHTAILYGRERGGWWKEEARNRLLDRVRGFRDGELWIVFDGSRMPEGPSDREREDAQPDAPRIIFAPSADDWLLSEVRRAATPAGLHLVTADRKLGDRARHHGARIVKPRAFLARCDEC